MTDRSTQPETFGVHPKFHNDLGVPEIHIDVREFECIGASPPHDHPHIYLDMGENDAILCPYCATKFVTSHQLESATIPDDGLSIDNSVLKRLLKPEGYGTIKKFQDEAAASLNAAVSEGWPLAPTIFRSCAQELALGFTR